MTSGISNRIIFSGEARAAVKNQSVKSESDPLISIVVPTLNRFEILAECLLAIDRQSYDNIQILVVDDGRSDAAERMISTLDLKHQIEYSRNDKVLGSPANKNLGISKARGKLVMILDDDSIVESDCIEKLVRAYSMLVAEGMKVGAVGPAMIVESRSSRKVSALDFGIRSLSVDNDKPCYRSQITGLVYENFAPKDTGIIPVDDLHANCLYPLSLLRSLGGYDEKSYKGNSICEENDLHARIRRAGYELFFVPNAIFHHKIASVGGNRMGSIRYGYYFLTNQWIYSMKNNGSRAIYQIPAQTIVILILALRMYLLYAAANMTDRRE